MMMRAFGLVLILAMSAATLASGASDEVVTAQILDYEQGYVFFTPSGDGFHVAPNVEIAALPSDAKTTRLPQARDYARVTFDTTGMVTKIELSPTKLPAEGDLGAIHRFAVALSTPAPNPDLAPQENTGAGCGTVIPGRRVKVSIVVQAPPTTGFTDVVYMTTDQAAWNAQAYRLDRLDALHYRTELSFSSGTMLHYLFDRGSSQSIELGENGIEREPLLLCIGSADAQSVTHTVYHWGDEQIGVPLPQPFTMPTPFNPAPFPNLPTPLPRPTR